MFGDFVRCGVCGLTFGERAFCRDEILPSKLNGRVRSTFAGAFINPKVFLTLKAEVCSLSVHLHLNRLRSTNAQGVMRNVQIHLLTNSSRTSSAPACASKGNL